MYYRKLFCAVVGVVALTTHLSAQTTEAQYAPRHTLKVNAPALINPNRSSVAFTSDFRVSENISIDVGVGCFYASQTFAQSQGENFLGPRLRVGVKEYSGRREAPMYFGLEAKMNYINNRSFYSVSRQGNQYLERLFLNRTIKSIGIAFRGGKHAPLFGRWFIDFYWGAGFLQYHSKRETLPPDASVFRRNDNGYVLFSYFDGKTHVVPDLSLGFHVGYAWK